MVPLQCWRYGFLISQLVIYRNDSLVVIDISLPVSIILIGDIPICSGFPNKLVLLYPYFCLVIFSHVLLVISKRLVIPRSFGGANPSNHGTKLALRGLLAFLLGWVILTSVGSFLISPCSTSWCRSFFSLTQ